MGCEGRARRRPVGALPLRAQDRRPRPLAAVRARPTRLGRHPRRRPGGRRRHRERASGRRHPASPRRHRAPRAGRSARRGVLQRRRFRVPQRLSGADGRPPVRQSPQCGERFAPAEDRGQEREAARRRPSAAVAAAHDGARHRSMARSTGRDAERDLCAAGARGDSPRASTSRSPTPRRRRMRSSSTTGATATTSSTRSTGSWSRSTSSPCTTSSERPAVHRAGRSRTSTRPSRSTPSCSTSSSRSAAPAARLRSPSWSRRASRAASCARRPSTIRTSSS